VKREASTRAPLARRGDSDPQRCLKKETAKTVSQLQSLKTTEMTLSTTSCRSGGQTDGQMKVPQLRDDEQHHRPATTRSNCNSCRWGSFLFWHICQLCFHCTHDDVGHGWGVGVGVRV